MNRILELQEIAVSLDEAIELNNSIPSPLAFVFNKYKNTPEFELKAVEKVKAELELKPDEQYLKVLLSERYRINSELKLLIPETQEFKDKAAQLASIIDQIQAIKSDLSDEDMKPEYSGVWEIHASDVFVALQQIEELIKDNHFFYAPLRLTGKEAFVQTIKE